MSKRAANGRDQADLSRPKRPRKEGIYAEPSSDVDIAMSDHGASEAEGDGEQAPGKVMTPQEVKALGKTLWETLQASTSKVDGRLQWLAFMKKPSKKDYPNYYTVIQHPIAFDDIKSKLDKGLYPTLEAVRQDFELCFNNAKYYNLEDSPIWVDAKELLKLANKTYSKLMGEKRSKPPSMNRLLKSRLQKLVDKTDETGRVLSTEFMELPSRKLWPIYYKEIKHPQCFNNVFKRLKKKEYKSAQEFAADVELIFSNCMAFNQEHTPIWDDALALKNHFRQLMADLPPPHSLPQYTQPTAKIKIKPPTVQASSSGSSLKLRIPTTSAAQKDAAPPPPAVPAPAPAPVPEPTLPVARNTARIVATPSAPAPAPVKPAPTPKLPVMKATAPPKPIATPNPRRPTPAQPQPTPAPQPHIATTSYSQAPIPSIPNLRAREQPKAPEPTVYTPPLAPIQNQQAPIVAPTPAPIPKAATPLPVHQHQLKCAKVEIKPGGRLLALDHRDGVKSWAVRLASAEDRIILKDISFIEQPDGEDESDEEEHEEEEAGEDDMEVDKETTPKKRGPGRPRKEHGKKRGRPPTRSSARQATLKVEKKKLDKPGEIQVKVNKIAVAQIPEKDGTWEIQLPAGYNVIELGEDGGMTWKLYADRMVAV